MVSRIRDIIFQWTRARQTYVLNREDEYHLDWSGKNFNIAEKVSACNSNNNCAKEIFTKYCQGYVGPGRQEIKCQITCRFFLSAQNGNAAEVSRVIKTDPTRLHARNNQGQIALHLAASRGHLDVVKVLVDNKSDLNAQDNCGNTPLHLATQNDNQAIIRLLMKSGAASDIKNKMFMVPVHIAADSGNEEAITVLLEEGADSNIRGENGNTALHYAAAKDHGNVIKKMLCLGAMPCQKCDFGYYPIHVAAKAAAANAMDAIIENAINRGYSREQVLSFKDRENNLPLHAAVHGGDIKAVGVCLKAGASVKAQQDDGSTPLHFAAAQGNMQMIKIMENSQSENFKQAIAIKDTMGMTPLHRAALFNHINIMDYLLDAGADINCKDNYERTPLLLGASKGNWATVKLLIHKQADVHVKDINNRNFFHLAIRFGGKLKEIGVTEIMDIQSLQNEKDNFGCTPVHYASREGHLLALDDLIRMGAILNMKNNEKQSPFHFAARYGRFNTCKRLLNSEHGSNIINETDGSGLTALHIAAQNGHTKVVQLLLERGAVVSRDFNDNSPLHYSACEGWTKCMKVLLSIHSNLLNATNLQGDTALHLAATKGQTTAVSLLLSMGAKLLKNHDDLYFMDYIINNHHTEVATAVINHERWEEVLSQASHEYGNFFVGFIHHLPEVCLRVLSRCQTPSTDDPRSSKYHISYNFRYLDTPKDELENREKSNENRPMFALNAMVENNRIDLLSHPVVVTFLRVKWNKYGLWIYAAYLLLYSLFLASLTIFVIENNSLKHHDSRLTNSTMINFLKGNHRSGNTFSMFHTCLLWFLALYSACNMVKEFAQMVMQKWAYFGDLQNALEWSLYVSTMIFVTPFLMGLSLHFQWESGAVAIFLAWFNCLVFLQRFDFFGIYVVMFLEILRTLVQVLIVFSILIIAFGLVFSMLLGAEENKAFSTPALSLLRTFVMMWEVDYMNSFNQPYVDDDPSSLHFSNLSLIFLIAFVLLMPILLMNLLIGLAVGDIETVKKDASLKRLAMQVELHTHMESKMPVCMRRKVVVMHYKQYPNRVKTKFENFLSKVSGSGTPYENDSSDPICAQDRYLYTEFYKQKAKMREMNSLLEKNNKLLRKIMEKMEIHTEEEAWDEGAGINNDDGTDDISSAVQKFGKGGQKSSKGEAYLKSAVVAIWQKR